MTSRHTYLITGLLCATTLVTAAIIAQAGPLNPPAGSVASSYKTLAEVEPRIAVNTANTPGTLGALFVISSPGSYYLTGNITAVPGKATIQITANDVTLDLNGFEISGVVNALDAISATAPTSGISIVNGSIANFPGATGIAALNVSGGRFADLTITGCGQEGMWVGHDSQVERVTVGACRNGIRCGNRTTVVACSVRDCTQRGIDAGGSCGIFLCNVIVCGGHGIYAVASATIDQCTAGLSTAGSGIVCPQYSTVTNCVASNNFANGFDVGGRSIVRDCVATGNGGHGFRLNFVSSASRCTSSLNGGCGFICDTSGGVDISDCLCTENSQSSAGAGIRLIAGGGTCRIQNNNLINTRIGIEVTSTRNIITGNTASFNTVADYSIGPSNTFGPIINAAGLGDLASIAGANHPHANFRN